MLLCLNLSSYVKYPFTQNAEFDFELLKKHSIIAERLMDDMVDLEVESIDRILDKIKSDKETDDVKAVELNLWKKIRITNLDVRRTGLGETALADALAMLNIKYGSQESIEMTGKIYKELAIGAHTSSCIMAKERGAFPIFNYEKEKNHKYISSLIEECGEGIVDLWKTTGRRNIALTTTAPTGSVSVVSQTSSGIEPVFLLSYTRRKKINSSDKNAKIDFVDSTGDCWQEFKVNHHGLNKWMEISGENDVMKSPYWGASSNEINWISSVNLQASAQKYVDHSISRTINLPENTTKELVSEIYLKAWESGCKGLTIYRDKSRAGVLINSNESNVIRPKKIIECFAPKRPEKLHCEINKAKVKGEAWTFFVGLLDNIPYEVFGGLSKYVDIPNKIKTGFIIKDYKIDGVATYNLAIGEFDDQMTIKDISNIFENPNNGTLTRFISLSLRHGVPLNFIVEQLSKDKFSDMTSFSRVMARVLKKYIKDGTKTTAEKKCPDCGKENSLIYQSGCVQCLNCSYSKC